MDAGVTVALVNLRQARGVVVALRAAAGEASDAILTGTPIVAGAACTLINVDVTHAACGWGGIQTPGLPPRAHPSWSWTFLGLSFPMQFCEILSYGKLLYVAMGLLYSSLASNSLRS